MNFYPRPLRGGRLEDEQTLLCYGLFLSTPSARRATSLPWRSARWRGYFYPRPLRGGRRRAESLNNNYFLFLSTPSARRATCYVVAAGASLVFLSTPSARRATAGGKFYRRPVRISIHALCEEGDDLRQAFQVQKYYISIHALCEEGDGSALSSYAFCKIFLSTPSARRATVQTSSKSARPSAFLSTPSARRATPPEAPAASDRLISIHALCEEGDVFKRSKQLRPAQFLSTPSARRATLL